MNFRCATCKVQRATCACNVLRATCVVLRATCLVLAVLLCSGKAAASDLTDYIGKPLADVRVELGGQLLAEPGVLALIQTRVGETLSLENVRESIDHLIGLGRFEDIRVFAEASAERPGAVALRWVLAPVQRINRITFSGDLEADDSDLRALLDDRIGARVSTS